MNGAFQKPWLLMEMRLAARGAAEMLALVPNEQLASAMLDSIPPTLREHPEVLAVRQVIRESLRQRWERCLQLAKRHIQANQSDLKGGLYLAYCQRRAERLTAEPVRKSGSLTPTP